MLIIALALTPGNPVLAGANRQPANSITSKAGDGLTSKSGVYLTSKA